MAELLLDNGADVEGGKCVGMSPLQLAVLVGNEVGVRLLLHRGADANMRGPNSRTAMHLCACSGDKKVIDYGLKPTRNQPTFVWSFKDLILLT